MKPPPFALHRPRDVVEALDLLATLDNNRLLAGGQSLMPMLNMRLLAPDHVIDLNAVDELRYIRDDGDAIAIGAMTCQRDVERSPIVAARLPLLRKAILNVGHRQTRNRGTIGGSVCHLDPSAEIPAVLLAMDATVTMRSARGARELAFSRFMQGLMTTALHANEMLTEVRIKPWAAAAGSGFVEFARRHGDFAVVSAAALVEKDSHDRVAKVSLVLGGMTALPMRNPGAESALVGASMPDALVLARPDEAADVMSDPAFPAWYRSRLAARLLPRALSAALGAST